MNSDVLCGNCRHFEDRYEIEGVVLCHVGRLIEPYCENFSSKKDRSRLLDGEPSIGFCWNCRYFEDRRDRDGSVMCALGRNREVYCEAFEYDLSYRPQALVPSKVPSKVSKGVLVA
jgi:hypothetical protein